MHMYRPLHIHVRQHIIIYDQLKFSSLVYTYAPRILILSKLVCITKRPYTPALAHVCDRSSIRADPEA